MKLAHFAVIRELMGLEVKTVLRFPRPLSFITLQHKLHPGFPDAKGFVALRLWAAFVQKQRFAKRISSCVRC